MIRGGVFGTTITTYSDPSVYDDCPCNLDIVGLWLMSEGHKYVVIE